MRVLVDSNVFDIVFNINNSNHFNYEPVYKCIVCPISSCKMIYGGTKFKQEIGSKIQSKYRGLFNELRKIGKLVELNQNKVNRLCDKLKRIEPSSKFNDEHIIACIILGLVNIVCTDDKRSDRFIKNKKFYNGNNRMIPKIYRYRRRHEKMFQNC